MSHLDRCEQLDTAIFTGATAELSGPKFIRAVGTLVTSHFSGIPLATFFR